MGKRNNLVDMVFGRLRVIELAETRHYSHGDHYIWRCQCSCGEICVVDGDHLKSGHTRSCGCLNNETRSKTHATHRMTDSKIYEAWSCIKARCFNPKDPAYLYYGGRGIKMYEPWINDFPAFYEHVSQLEHFGETGYSLDRINNGGNYEPGNLRWATKTEQARNRRSNIIVEYHGRQMTLIEASELSGINYGTLRKRIKLGWSNEDLFRLVKK